MQILEQRSKFVTNCEVASHLKEIKQWQKEEDEQGDSRSSSYRRNNKTASFDIIAGNVQRYFAKTPAASQTVEAVQLLVLEQLSQFELEKIEKLQLVNLLPQNTVNLYAIVEECDMRFSEDQCTTILNLLACPENSQDDDEDVEMQ